MQVATLQERMSANYLASNMAFQRAEMVVRNAEGQVMSGLATQYEDCAAAFDPQAWVDAVPASTASTERIRIIGVCMGKCSAGLGSGKPCDWYRITGFSRDRDTAAESSSQAAIDTIFLRP